MTAADGDETPPIVIMVEETYAVLQGGLGDDVRAFLEDLARQGRTAGICPAPPGTILRQCASLDELDELAAALGIREAP